MFTLPLTIPFIGSRAEFDGRPLENALPFSVTMYPGGSAKLYIDREAVVALSQTSQTTEDFNGCERVITVFKGRNHVGNLEFSADMLANGNAVGRIRWPDTFRPSEVVEMNGDWKNPT